MLKCVLFNARSLGNKLLELHHLLYTTDYDVLLITEFWLNRPPSSGIESDAYMCDLVEFLKSHHILDCMNVIAVDFNCPKISWDNLQRSTDRSHQLLLSCVNDYGLTQEVDFNTRLQHVLDIVLTDEPQQILKVTSTPPLGQSDHDMIKFDVMVYNQLSCHDGTPSLYNKL